MKPQKNPIHGPTLRCDQRSMAGDTSLIALNLSARDYAVLMAASYFFASFANPAGAAWMSVILSSDDFFPDHTDSPRVVQSVLSIVHEIRISRKSMLRFSNPHCLDCANIVTAAERHFISILADVRDGNLSGATTHAMLLCEGYETSGVLKAAANVVVELSAPLDVCTASDHVKRCSKRWTGRP